MGDARKTRILNALRVYTRQRPGLEFGNYGDFRAYRSEMRSITADLAVAQRLIDAVAWRDISADAILHAAQHSYSGRLSITELPNGKTGIDYCAGQYWPTEYRRAVAAVMASALWDYVRDYYTPADCENKGDYMRRYFRREFGRGIARRFFN